MGHITTNRASSARATLGIAATTLLLLAIAAPALATDQHLYDPVLSLTGNTTVTTEDPVPDPGPTHPPKGFLKPCGTTTDSYGNVYVASVVEVSFVITGGRIDVFGPAGQFLLEFEVDHFPCDMAVDSQGNLYVGGVGGNKVGIYAPSAYPPSASSTFSLAKKLPVPVVSGCPESTAIAVDPSNDHLHIGHSCRLEEYGPAAEGSPFLGEIQGAPRMRGMDVYGKNHDYYVAALDQNPGGDKLLPSKFFVIDGDDGSIKCELLGATTPGLEEDLDFGIGAAVAVDQSNGDAYVYDVKHGVVYQFAVKGKDECGFIGRLPAPPALSGNSPLMDIAVDAPLQAGEAGYHSPNKGYVFVTSGKNAAGSHLFAYEPVFPEVEPPLIRSQSFSGAAQTEAVLEAELNPSGLDTKYHFEYTTQASFETEGYAGATTAPIPDADAGAGGAFVTVSVPALDLEPDTSYRFRLVATSCDDERADPDSCITAGEGVPGGEGADANFSTYPVPPVSTCPNASLRIGASAALPDCRAYELVTPPDTGGHIPTMAMLGDLGSGDISFGTAMASPGGSSLVFGSNMGALQGFDGTGYIDIYEALRDGKAGWQTRAIGMTGAQAESPFPGGISSDHGYSFWNIEKGKGSLSMDSAAYAVYLRVPGGMDPSPNCAPAVGPGGHFEWLACGSLGFDPAASGRWISEDGGHVVFVTGYDGGAGSFPLQLEPCAAPSGIRTIYDRTPGGPTQCVSVPPTGASAETNALFETKDPGYRGTSADGSTIVFELGGTLYARLDNTETVEVAKGSATFGGVSRDGSRVFYLKDAPVAPVRRGEIYACEVSLGPCAGPDAIQEPTQIGAGGESIIVNISADGSHLYFVSPQQLDGGAGKAGKGNLYMWDGNSVRFIAVLDPLDIDGESDPEGQGLGLWVGNVVAGKSAYGAGPGRDPSRSTADGSVLVFKSRADLTGYESDGHSQVFRYDSSAPAGKRLLCLSCNPTGEPPSSDALLQVRGGDPGLGVQSVPPINSLALIESVTADGRQVFFQSGERLVTADLDGKLDVYEWQARGAGGCERAGGCLALISGRSSTADEYIYATTPDGHDVFFFSGDTLVPQDPDKTPSVYDARVEGGFPPPTPPPGECLGEACQPTAVAPDDPSLTSLSFSGAGNVREEGARKPRCPKGKRKVRSSNGKIRCVKRQAKKKHRKHHRANANRRAAR